MKSLQWPLAVAGAVSMLGIAATAGAQAAPSTAANAPAPGSDVLEEVVVTAEKRSTDLMSTAVAMSALSGNALTDKNITDLEGLTATTPSFTYDNQGPTSAVNIRGIGLIISSPDVAPGVPLYRDGLLAPTLLPNEPFLDIGDVEVLRGPQGTLVGSNSTGGAVFFNTRSPSIGGRDGFIQLEGGSYDHVGLQAAQDIPVNDAFAMRAALSYEKTDSFWKDLDASSANHAPPGATNQIAGRLSMLYQPNGQFSMLLKINFQDDQNGGMAHTPYPLTPPAYGYPTGKYVLAYEDPNTEYSDYQIRAGLEIKYKFDSGVSFRSMSGFINTYEYYDEQEYVTDSPTTASSAPFINRIQDHVYSQEFNLLSPDGARLHWVLGTFSQHWPAHINLNPNALPTGFVDVDEGTQKDSNALFGEAGYNFTPMLELHAGARGTFDHAWGSGGVFLSGIPGSPEVASNQVGQTDSLFTGRIGVNWQATPDQFVYGFIARGAKTGGINGGGIPDFAPETVLDYEGGLKSNWAGGHLRTEIGVFYMDYKNLQLSVLVPQPGPQAPAQDIANIGQSTIKGAEFSTQAHFGGFQLDGNVAYVHSAIGNSPPLLNPYLYGLQGLNPEGLQCAPGQTVGCFDYTPYYQSANGVPNPYSPMWTANVGAQYDIALGDERALTPRVDYSMASMQWATVLESPTDRFQARHILNVDLSYLSGSWKFTAYGTNVNGDYYISGQSGAQNFWGAPAEYGLRITKIL